MPPQSASTTNSVVYLWNLYEDELSFLLGSLNIRQEDDTWAKLFKKVEWEKLWKEIAKETVKASRGRVILKYLKRCPILKAAEQHVLTVIKARNENLYKRLSCDSMDSSDRSYYMKLLKYFDTFTAFLKPVPLIQQTLLSSEFTRRIGNLGVNENADKKTVVQILFRELPYSGVEDWYWEFLSAVKSSGNNGDLMDYCFNTFDEDYAQHIVQKELLSKNVDFVDVGDNLADSLSVNLNKEHLPVTILNDAEACGSHNSTAEKDNEEELELRSYQEELARPALAGVNTIICAPTGSGKTWVAVRIIMEHLEKIGRGGQQPVVAFLVPTVPLVSQQMTVLKRYLPAKWKVGYITGGDSDVPKNLMIQQNHLTVMTPQLLLNMLRDKDEANRLEIVKFSLIVIDECHHCNQSHPYNDIMTFYHDRKFGPRGFPSVFKPQIVCLTASLGVGKGTDDLAEATEHILRLAANMDAEEVSTVEKNTQDLHTHMNSPIDQVERVPALQERNGFSIVVYGIMSAIEKQIQPVLEQLEESRVLDGVPVNSCDRKCGLKYKNWVSQLLVKVPLLKCPDRTIQLLMSCLHHLDYYNFALELNSHVLVNQAVKYLENTFTELRPKSDIEKKLVNLYRESVMPKLEGVRNCSDLDTNLLVKNLVEILLAECRRGADFRVIIFVRTRYLTGALKDCLTQMSAFREMNVETLTAVNASGEKGGQTEATQARILSDFKLGHCKIIVATTVAEEGLDIPECNLVIKYNHVTNEIAMVQRRGRGRARGSRSVLLALEGWIAEKEMQNILREKLMLDAIQKIKEMDKEDFRERVEVRAQSMYKDRILQQQLDAQRKTELALNRFNIQCRTCIGYLCESTTIRRVQASHYVCVDSDIWSRCNARPVDPEKVEKFFELAIPGKAYCIECNTLLGNVVKFKGVYLPTLKAEFIVLEESSTGNRKTLKKWKRIIATCFVPDEIQRVEIACMGNSPPYSKDALEKLLNDSM